MQREHPTSIYNTNYKISAPSFLQSKIFNLIINQSATHFSLNILYLSTTSTVITKCLINSHWQGNHLNQNRTICLELHFTLSEEKKYSLFLNKCENEQKHYSSIHSWQLINWQSISETNVIYLKLSHTVQCQLVRFKAYDTIDHFL